MTGKHSPGYQAAYQAALREAAKRWREDNPDQWAQLLAGHVEATRSGDETEG